MKTTRSRFPALLSGFALTGFVLSGLILSGLALTGCADSKLEGEIEGEEFGKVLSAFFLKESSSVEEYQLVLTNYGGGCLTYNTYFNLNSEPAEELPLNALFVRFFVLDPLQVGAYEILAGDEAYSDGLQWVHAWFRTYSDEGWTGPTASEGLIEFDTIEDNLLTGTVSVTLSSGDILEGKFAAEYCESEF